MGYNYIDDSIRAVDAKFEAQKIAFAPFAFQAARTLRALGILAALDAAGEDGLNETSIVGGCGVSAYAVRVLLEMALSMGIVKLHTDDPERFLLGKVGFFLLHDQMTRVNMDFVHDVCFQGSFALEASLREGRPAGLEVFGTWPTIYQGLASLPEPVRKSWFGFDHFYSDAAFPAALPHVFARKPRALMDIGGNTAKWALACHAYDPEVRVTIVDLPGQSREAQGNIKAARAEDRLGTHEADMLDPSSSLPDGHDAVWMSQFLDCFALGEVTSILRKIACAIGPEADVWVLEPLWDKQRYPAASYSLHATSLYFACMANGNSKMYGFEELTTAIEAAGFRLEEAVHDVGAYDYSLLRFKRRP